MLKIKTITIISIAVLLLIGLVISCSTEATNRSNIDISTQMSGCSHGSNQNQCEFCVPNLSFIMHTEIEVEEYEEGMSEMVDEFFEAAFINGVFDFNVYYNLLKNEFESFMCKSFNSIEELEEEIEFVRKEKIVKVTKDSSCCSCTINPKCASCPGNATLCFRGTATFTTLR